MSRGLGALQREILETLQTGNYRIRSTRGVHDLGNCRWQMARERGFKQGNAPERRSFSASFSRAVRGLIEDGYMEVVNKSSFRLDVRLKKRI